MTARGVLFAIDEKTAKRLTRAADDDDAAMEIIEELEEEWDEANLAETDKAWDAIHRALTDGALEWDNGSYPLNHVILGGLGIIQSDDYIAILKSPDQVRDVASAVGAVDAGAMAALYANVVPRDYAPEYGDEDRDYTVEWFDGVRALYRSAAASGRWVLFTVDQ